MQLILAASASHAAGLPGSAAAAPPAAAPEPRGRSAAWGAPPQPPNQPGRRSAPSRSRAGAGSACAKALLLLLSRRPSPPSAPGGEIDTLRRSPPSKFPRGNRPREGHRGGSQAPSAAAPGRAAGDSLRAGRLAPPACRLAGRGPPRCDDLCPLMSAGGLQGRGQSGGCWLLPPRGTFLPLSGPSLVCC